MQERRHYPRISVSFPVECTTLNDSNYFYTVTKDIGLGGTQILASHFLAKNTILKVALNFIDSLIVMKAQVAWCNKKRASEHYNVGLEFVEVPQTRRQDIAAFLTSLA